MIMESNNETIKFLRGSYEAYQTAISNGQYTDALFFDTTNHTIYLGGTQYGGTEGASLDILKDWINTNYGYAIWDLDEVFSDEGYTGQFITLATDPNNPNTYVASEAMINIPVIGTEQPNSDGKLYPVGLISLEDKQKIDDFENKYVQKETGSRLISQAEINKLSNIDDSAQQNIIESITIDGASTFIDDKKNVDLKINAIIDSKITGTISSVYHYKGSFETQEAFDAFNADLTKTKQNGDVYNLAFDSQYGFAGVNVAWNADTNEWDTLGGYFNINPITDRITNIESRTDTLEDDYSTLDTRTDAVEDSIKSIIGTDEVAGIIETTAQTIATEVINNALKWETI